MSVLFKYISKIFLKHCVIMMIGLSAIFIVFDVLANASDITQNTDNALKTLWHYMGLRLPSVYVLITPMAVLLAAMVTLHKMVKSQEMVAAGSAGFTIYKIAAILLSGALLIALLQFLISDYIVTDTSTRLRLWAAENYTSNAPEAPNVEQKLWLRTSDYILHYEAASPDGAVLFNPLLILRNDQGLIENYTRAVTASYYNDQWTFEDVYQTNFKKQERDTSLKLNLNLQPSDLSIQDISFEEMKFSTLWRLTHVKSYYKNSTPSPIYEVWLGRKIAQPFSVLLMVILAAPMGLFMARRYNALIVSFGFVSAGFLYFITERILLSLGEIGTLPVFLAVWSPFLIFSSMSVWFMLHKQE